MGEGDAVTLGRVGICNNCANKIVKLCTYLGRYSKVWLEKWKPEYNVRFLSSPVKIVT